VGSLKRLSAGVAKVMLQPEAPAPRAERNTRDSAPVSGHQLQLFAFFSGPSGYMHAVCIPRDTKYAIFEKLQKMQTVTKLSISSAHVMSYKLV